jgi:general secretion pathway protein B
MSYILEALADSEQARQQIAATPKYSLLSVVGEELPRHRRWPYALAGALLVNAAVLQVWLHPVLPGGLASIKVATMPQVAETPAAAPAPGIAARSEMPAADVAGIALPEARPPQYQSERANDRRVARSPAPADAVPRTASANSTYDGALILMPKLAPKATAKRGAEAAVATEPNPRPSPTEANPTAAGGTIPAGGTGELPPVPQQEMPALNVAGFIRGEGSGSMVIVNDRLVREGDEVAPGVVLEKILNDSLVFNYKGYRFKR